MAPNIGRGEWYKANKKANPDFHPDPTKLRDPAMDLYQKRGFEDAEAELLEKLAKDPKDTEAQRQLDLLRKRLQH